MNGVEILSSAQVASEFAFNWAWFWIAFGATLGIGLIVGIWNVVSGECESYYILSCLIVGIICGVAFGVIFGDVGKLPTAYETHHKVTIDDSVSMTEFLDKYEIIDQEGKIYTVREKE